MFNILNIILPTFVIIFVGYIFGKTTKINFSSIVDIVFYIGIPALIFISMLEKEIDLLDASKVWAAAIVIMFGCGIVARITFTILRQKHSGLYLPISLMNTVNIPFPIIYLAYGADGLFAATLFYIPNTLLMYSLGVFMAAGKQWKENMKEIFKVPPIYAVFLALILNLSKIKLPELIIRPLDLVSMMTIPLVLLILGYNLSRVKISSFPTTLLASVLRVGVGLLFGILAVNILNLTGVFRSVVILNSAMPAAALTSILATKYNNESDLVSSVVFVTTVTSLIVIPALLYILS